MIEEVVRDTAAKGTDAPLPATLLKARPRGLPVRFRLKKSKKKIMNALVAVCYLLDEVLGGGIVPGSVILLAGEPGYW